MTTNPESVPDLSTLPPDALLTRRQVHLVSGFSLQILKAWPRQGRGPKVTMVENCPRYRCADVRAWLGLDDSPK